MLEPDFDLGRNLYLNSKDPYGSYGRKRQRVKEAPVIIWSKDYEKNPAKFLDHIEDVSRCLLFNGPSLYDDENPNHIGLFDLAKGKIRPEDYLNAEFAYGDKGATPVRDNHFFFGAKNHSISQIVSQPLRFSCKNISNEYTKNMRKQDIAKAKKLIKTLFAQAMAQEGANLEFLEDKSMNLNGNKDEILERLFPQEKLELIVYKLLQDMNYRHDIMDVARESFDHKLDVNAQFAFLDVINGDVIPKSLHPNSVRWISGRPIKTMEDRSVSACSFINYLTFNEVLNKYSTRLNTGTGARGLLSAIDSLKEGVRFPYNEDGSYFSEYYKANVLITNISDQDNDKYDTWGKVDYMKNIFYPFRRSAYGIGHSILEHRMFFKVQKPARYLVEINGKPATETMFDKWKKEDFNRDLIANFEEIDPEERKPKGAYVIEKHKEELWEATQIGHATLINVGRYEYTAKKTGSETYVGMPIVAQISRNKSMVLVGENFSRWVNILYMRTEEILDQAGISTALMIDESIMGDTDAKSILYNAKKTGILMFNSSRYAGGNAFSGQHLTTLKMGHHLEEINNWMAMIGMFQEAYNRLVGSSEQTLGVTQKYDSTQKTQLNIANQTQLKADNYYEHYKFMNQLLQRAADISKKVYAKDDYKHITLSTGEREFLKLTSELNLADYDVYMESGSTLRDKKQIIDNAVINVLSSGGIEMIEPLIQVLASDNPAEALSIFRGAKELIMQREEAASQQAAQQAQAMAQISAQKNQIPLERENIITQREFALQGMKNEEQRERENFKGTMADIKENNDREKKLLDSDLGQEIETHRAALNREFKEPATAQ